MVNGTYNPVQLVIVRELMPGHVGFDTAFYRDVAANYSITTDPATGVTTVRHLVAGGAVPEPLDPVEGMGPKNIFDATDRLTHIERLQFSDTFVDLVPNLDAHAVGLLTINNTAPVEGQTLTVSAANITDPDNVSLTNQSGAVTGPISYYWQAEAKPGTGVFEDLQVRNGFGVETPLGPSFTIPNDPHLVGLNVRVVGVFEDAHGVQEMVFSDPTGPIQAAPFTPPVHSTIDPQTSAPSTGVRFTESDLSFILDQIKIGEANAAGTPLRDLVPNWELPFGLRTLSGVDNNLLPDDTQFGSADNVFPRLATPPIFRTADVQPAAFFAPGTPAGTTPTSYAQTNGFVFDSQPRTISNLVVDQTAANPVSYATAFDPCPDGVLNFGAPGNDDVLKPHAHIVTGTRTDGTTFQVFQFDNVAPDFGVSLSFNEWMTFFGQFFDHGLDLVNKGGNGFIFIPLKPDDPLFNPASPQTNFMVETRATMLPGPDHILGTADDIHENTNQTSPFVDQNQTYSSHPSHQVFLRAYEMRVVDAGLPTQHVAPFDTGKLIENRDLGPDGIFGTADDVLFTGQATWKVVKAQARDVLGINLTDADVTNVPLLATDDYGNFIRGPHGFVQVVVRLSNGPDGLAGTADDVTTLVESSLAAPIDLAHPIAGNPAAVVVRTGHPFLVDIAANANPFGPGPDGLPGTADDVLLTPDADNIINTTPPAPGFYDNELLDRHFIAGDGRVNENIGLTAVHHIFHSEHNRLVDHTKQVLLATAATGDVSFINEWLLTPLAAGAPVPTNINDPTLDWNGERLFQAAKFGTEMQYQHLVFEEFARTIDPFIDGFRDFDPTINPAIVAEFAHTVFRFGHSMLDETVDRLDPNFASSDLGLIQAFLNPLAFDNSGTLTAEQAAGALARGLTREVGNEIDEFVTEAVRNNLLGLPLDLPVLNITRGRDTGIPSLNAARADFFAHGGDMDLKPYGSWYDYALNLRHPESLVNFIAAYGTHPTITAATTTADKRAAAMAIVFGGPGAPADSFDFLHSQGAWASKSATNPTPAHALDVDGVSTTGLGTVDFWIGGLAEQRMPFGQMLGSTFTFVFESQLEALQNNDRLYYLHRTAGMDFLPELENNSFANLIMTNTDTTHLPGEVFKTPDFFLELD